MDFFHLLFILRPNPIKEVGYIDKDKINRENMSIFHNSLACPCENCAKQTFIKIYETSTHYSLFFIPLGNGDYLYHAYCNECNSLILRFGLKDLIGIEKLGIYKTKANCACRIAQASPEALDSALASQLINRSILSTLGLAGACFNVIN